MSEDKLVPLMAEFLRTLARELESNRALARRLAAPLRTALAEAVPLPAVTSKGKRQKTTKQRKYPVPEGFNPFEIFYNEGSPGLYHHLQSLEIEQLKGVLANFTNIPRQEYVNKRKREPLVEMVVQGVKDVATRGVSFGDYRLEEE